MDGKGDRMGARGVADIVLPPVANAREDVHVAEEGRLVLSVQFDSVLEVLCREVQPRVRHFHRSSQPVVGVRDHFRLFRNLHVRPMHVS